MSSMREQLAALGPYFAAESHDPATGPAREPWRSLGELLDDLDVLVGRVDAVRGYLAAAGGPPVESIEPRVAASVMHLGLAARTLSPLFGLAVLGLRLPRSGSGPLSLRDLRWQPTLGSMFALSIPHLDHAQPPQSPRTVQNMEDIVSVAAELCGMTRDFGVSPKILWGNITSALNGARIAASIAGPKLAPAAQAELDRLLTSGPLAGTSRTTTDGRFLRRSCCLMYRAAPDRRGPLCGDCVLIDNCHRHRHRHRALAPAPAPAPDKEQPSA